MHCSNQGKALPSGSPKPVDLPSGETANYLFTGTTYGDVDSLQDKTIDKAIEKGYLGGPQAHKKHMQLCVFIHVSQAKQIKSEVSKQHIHLLHQGVA